MNRNDFGAEFSGGVFSDWRKKGKIIAFVHPDSEIAKRVMVSFRRVIKDKNGKEKIATIRRHYNGDADITRQFLLWLEHDATDIDLDDVVLRVETSDGDVEEFLKGDILGIEKYDWRKNIFFPKTEFLFCVIDVTDKDAQPAKCEILSLPMTAGKKLNRIWLIQEDELGEDGNPFVNPYSFRIDYDKFASGSDMYTAQVFQRPLTPAVREIMNCDPINMLEYEDPKNVQDPDAGNSFELLRQMCVIDCPLLEVDIEEEQVEKSKRSRGRPAKSASATAPARPAKPKPKAKRTAKRTAKKTATKAVTKESPKTAVKASPSEVAAPAAEASPPARPATPGELVTVSEDSLVAGKRYVYDGEMLKYVEWRASARKGVFEDADGIRLVIKEGESVEVPNGVLPDSDNSGQEVDSSNVDNGEMVEVVVADCEKGKFYQTDSGDTVKYLRYNKTQKKGVFVNDDNERVLIPENSTVYECDDSDSGSDRQVVTKPVTSQTKPASVAGQEDDDVKMEPCPNTKCGQMVHPDADSCVHCGVDYYGESDEEEECPNEGCGEMISIDALKCKGCGVTFDDSDDSDDTPF